MIYIRHRVNQASGLASLEPGHGAEIDVRSQAREPGSLHVTHDPWTVGEPLDAWLAAFAARQDRGPLIVNTKEDGLEAGAMALLAKHRVTDYFFLDTALPTLVKWALVKGIPHFALRLSRHEPLASLASFRGKARWVWVDCFGGEPLPPETVAEARRDFKVCLVSPELQGRDPAEIARFAGLVPHADAVCTKRPDLWARG